MDLTLKVGTERVIGESSSVDCLLIVIEIREFGVYMENKTICSFLHDAKFLKNSFFVSTFFSA